MAKVKGTFYFKSTVNGNLLGEFTNNNSKEIMTESATLDNDLESELIFVGNYRSVWFDIVLKEMNLEIREEGIKYYLSWSENGIEIYKGEGFLVDEILVGHYYQL